MLNSQSNLSGWNSISLHPGSWGRIGFCQLSWLLMYVTISSAQEVTSPVVWWGWKLRILSIFISIWNSIYFSLSYSYILHVNIICLKNTSAVKWRNRLYIVFTLSLSKMAATWTELMRMSSFSSWAQSCSPSISFTCTAIWETWLSIDAEYAGGG